MNSTTTARPRAGVASGPAFEMPLDPTTRLRLRPSAVVVPVLAQSADQTRLHIAIGQRFVQISGADAPRIVALVDGTRTVQEICDALDAFDSDNVTGVLRALQMNGVTEAIDDDPPSSDELPRLARALAEVGLDVDAVIASLARLRVALFGESLTRRHVEAAIDGWRLAISHPPIVNVAMYAEDGERLSTDAIARLLSEADVAVFCDDRCDILAVDRFNAAALQTGVPWLSVRLAGLGMRIGPFFVPNETACAKCLEHRTLGNATYADQSTTFADAIRDGRAVPREQDNLIANTIAAAANVVGVEILRFAVMTTMRAQPELFGRYVDYHPLSSKGTVHDVLRLPRCPACGAHARGRPSERIWMEPYDYRTPNR